MSHFNAALDYLLPREGELEEDRKDPGGVTKYGISLRFLKSLSNESLRTYGFAASADTIGRVDVEQMTPGQAASVYHGEFWQHAWFSRISNQDVCNYLFDACVNMGLAPGVKCLQRAIWAVARNRAVLVDDGILGEDTLDQANGCSPAVLLAAMRSERAGEYRLIANVNTVEGKEDLEGWLNRSYNQKA